VLAAGCWFTEGVRPPQAAERARESVEARMPPVVVQAYYIVIGLEGWAVPDGQV